MVSQFFFLDMEGSSGEIKWAMESRYYAHTVPSPADGIYTSNPASFSGPTREEEEDEEIVKTI